ncbi:aminoglycoside 3-N-acetyltransferase [Paludibaculum fermentans]|uniref:Aminoglycoside N(3)-acetyltransferase n=1 Tax=Paludibaculum fermentans TaxID=1473598 RepID=A0A7S7NL16_PALFE|nr:aminoglycoside 3-N-acetyltransferase [Paludibaculum fermentans]QOY85519.1 aminoglycoside 3-N-acetyltransferase [Paludibaculum fermentans]
MIATRSSLRADFNGLGIRAGEVLMVHSSVRAMGEVRGGVNVIVQALLDTLGPSGTLVAYLDFEPCFEDEDEEEVPVFDKRIAHAARDHGILHETIRNWPGTLRSDHPDAGVAALGAQAEWITAEHPFQYGYGPGTPLEKVVRAKGRVLMLGAPLDTITLLHYAEHQARLPDKRIRRYRRLMPGAEGPQWVEFEEFDTADPVHDLLPQNCFEQIATAYLAEGRGVQGRVGAADAYLFDGPELVEFGIQWLERFVTNGIPAPQPE